MKIMLVCPQCSGALSNTEGGHRCSSCGRFYPSCDEIPDLRALDGDFPVLFDEDERRAQALRAHRDGLSLPELIRMCYELHESRTPQALDISASFIACAGSRTRADLEACRDMIQRVGWPLPDTGAALDVGCGCGLGTLALAEEHEHVVGLNPAGDELAVARKAASESDQENVIFVKAFAERMPFADNYFDLIYCSDTIEHLVDYGSALRECCRVLRPGGFLFCLNSANRYNLVGRDGHVHVRFVGCLPECLREPYVRLVVGVAHGKCETYGLCHTGTYCGYSGVFR